MLFCFHKYLFHLSKGRRCCKEEGGKVSEMVSPFGGDSVAAESSASGCCHSPCLGHAERTDSNDRVSGVSTPSARTARSDFAKHSISSLFPNPHFTNHESIPPLLDAFFDFTAAFPQYCETRQADHIRDGEYGHLGDHVCLDYSGVNLFSHDQMNNPAESQPSTSAWRPPFFTISYKSTSLKSEVEHGEQDRGFEFAVRKRIMSFLKVSGEDYGMICTTNRTAAFKLLGETYPFHSNKKLLTVYDYESEAVSAMAESAEKRGARVMSSSFCWPGLRIHSTKLKKMLSRRKAERKKRGLFVFPHMSRMSGVRYPYLWMQFAKENGWHVVLDACTLGPKDMNTLGIRLIQPDFIICSFFKVFGENPSGFAGLFIKKSSLAVLQTSILARSIGIVNIIPAQRSSDLPSEEIDTTSSFSGPIPVRSSFSGPVKVDKYKEGEKSDSDEPKAEFEEERQEEHEDGEDRENLPSEIIEVRSEDNHLAVVFTGLDHADSLGLTTIHNRLRCLTNWLVIALLKLQHPHPENGESLVKIYGPKVKFDRGPALAFNVFDWKGEKICPALVQKLADRSNISLSCGFLHQIMFSEKYEQVKSAVLEDRIHRIKASGNKKKENHNLGIEVVNASFCYLANFEDVYRLWAFVAKFLDADFVEKERWRYTALNQTIVEL